jgi:hypothetical protein
MSYVGNTVTTQGFIPAVDYFNGTGSATAFTLSKPVASVAQVEAVISNVVQNPSDAYTVSGNTITFTSAPPTGTNNVYVRYTSPITQVIAPGQGTVTTTSFASSTGTGAVVLATSPTITTPTLTSPTVSGTTTGLSQEVGQCRLTYTSGTVLTLVPFNGQYIKIAGVMYAIPSAGVTLSNSGLVASTRYYIYAYISGGNVTLSASTTAYATDTASGNVGVKILSGNNAYTLVGMIYTSSGSLFIDAVDNRWVLSYFNRLQKIFLGTTSNYSTTSTSMVVGTPAIVTGLNWADEGICIMPACQGGMTGSYALQQAVYDNNVANTFGVYQYVYTTGASTNFPVQLGGWVVPTEGYHAYYISYGAVSGSGTVSINNGALTGFVRG